MRICTLASGSSGNSLLLETGYSKILVDAGISKRQITRKLSALDVSLEDIDAVITTHEHQDHTISLSRLDLPVYVASKTINLWKDKVKVLNEFDTGEDFRINDLDITPFSVPHDAIDPVGFTINADDKKIGIVTDIGSVTGLVVQKLRNSDVLIIESNHDTELILYSNYPWELKQRIRSRQGHLSNIQSAELVGQLINDRLKAVVLAHLSEINNTPEAALRHTSDVLDREGAQHVRISVAPRKHTGEVIQF